MSKEKGKDKGKAKAKEVVELPPLHHCASINNMVGLRELLVSEANLDIDAVTKDKSATALMHACYRGHYKATALLLEMGAGVRFKDSEGRTCLHHACFSGSPQIISLCLLYGADPREVDAQNRLPLDVYTLAHPKNKAQQKWLSAEMDIDPHQFTKSELKILAAIDRNDEMKVLEKLDKNRSVQVCNKDRIFSLTWAVRQNKYDLVDLLLMHCADVNQPDQHRNTPLHWAALRGFTRVAELLLEDLSILLNVPNAGQLLTPLHLAASHGHVGVLNLLLEAGADPHVLSNTDQTPLHLACQQSQSDCARQLIAYGADISLADAFDVYPIHLAASAGDINCVHHLAAANVDINAITNSGRTALMSAATAGDAQMVAVLLEYGGRPNMQNSKGDTALHLALENLSKEVTDVEVAHCYLDVIRNLAECPRSDLEVTNKKLHTPLMSIPIKRALRAKSPEQAAAIILARRGADLNTLLRPPIPQDNKDLVAILREAIAKTKALEDGWEHRTTQTLRKRDYYVNKAKKIKQWEDPRVQSTKNEASTSSPIAMDNIMCPLCLELLYRPVTTACGHSFCQPCIKGAIAFQAKCPLCRADVVGSADDLKVNTLLADIIQGAYPEQWDARRLDLAAVEGN